MIGDRDRELGTGAVGRLSPGISGLIAAAMTVTQPYDSWERPARSASKRSPHTKSVRNRRAKNKLARQSRKSNR